MNDLLKQAIEELKIDVPVLSWTVQGGKMTLLLYGGQVRIWEVVEPAEVSIPNPQHKRNVRKKIEPPRC
jgi:hypothetical protein